MKGDKVQKMNVLKNATGNLELLAQPATTMKTTKFNKGNQLQSEIKWRSRECFQSVLKEDDAFVIIFEIIECSFLFTPFIFFANLFLFSRCEIVLNIKCFAYLFW